MGPVETNLKELTLSVWVRLNLGYSKYPLISYVTENSTGMLAIGFSAKDAIFGNTGGAGSGNGGSCIFSDESISHFFGNLLDKKIG